MKERRQFGQPVGRFQAVQHKLANNLIALEGVRLTLEHAAESRDLAAPSWPCFANAAIAFAARRCARPRWKRRHAFGAIGYAEREAPRHSRRAHLDTLRLGGARLARAELGAALLDHAGARVPEYDLGPAGNAFRDEVRAWLSVNWSGERKRAFDALPFHRRRVRPRFARDMGRTSSLPFAWPKALAGPDARRWNRSRLRRGDGTRRGAAFGASVQANALMMFGTPEQQARYLPEILRGEVMHSMG